MRTTLLNKYCRCVRSFRTLTSYKDIFSVGDTHIILYIRVCVLHHFTFEHYICVALTAH